MQNHVVDKSLSSSIEYTISYEALSSPARSEWIIVMRDELDSKVVKQVWQLVDLPCALKSIGNKWVIKVKREAKMD